MMREIIIGLLVTKLDYTDDDPMIWKRGIKGKEKGVGSHSKNFFFEIFGSYSHQCSVKIPETGHLGEQEMYWRVCFLRFPIQDGVGHLIKLDDNGRANVEE